MTSSFAPISASPKKSLVPASEFSTDIRELLTCDLPEELRKTKLQIRFRQKKTKPKSVVLKEKNDSFSVRKGKPRRPYRSGGVTFEDRFWAHQSPSFEDLSPSERWEIPFDESEMAEVVLFVMTYNNFIKNKHGNFAEW